MSDEAILDTCGCCKGTEPLTPASLENPHGLSAIAYRIGTHATFKETMLAGLSRQRKLDRLTTRDSDDPSIALVDAAATMLDVLTFYQERIANEGYLRTAAERRSILELARSIGYELSPGVAASTYLAFELETAPGSPELVPIDKGTKVQSLPGPGEKPQTFETIEQIEARSEWNGLKPQLLEAQMITRGLTKLYLKGTNTQLQSGDAILLVGDEREKSPGDEHWDFRILQTVTPYREQDYTVITWAKKLGWRKNQKRFVDPAAKNVVAFAFRQRAALFGHNAPDWRSIPDTVKKEYLKRKPTSNDTEWPHFNIAYADPVPGSFDKVFFDAVYPKIAAGGWIVLDMPGYTELYKVTDIATDARTDFALTAKTTRVGVDASEHLSWFGLRETVVFAQVEKLELAERSITNPVSGNTIALDHTVQALEPERAIIVSGRRRKRVQVAVNNLDFFADDGLSSRKLNQKEVLEVIESPSAEPDGTLRWRLMDKDGKVGFVMTKPGNILPHPASEEDQTLNELAFIKETQVSSDQERTILILKDLLKNTYDPGTVKIFANVAKATHGETKCEVLGSGQAGQPFQRFALKQKPLTYVSAPTPSGHESTLEVRVNDIHWDEVPSLYAQGPKDPIYTARLADDGTVSVQFGDGAAGARLPTGTENVVATYRVGTGLAGLVKANQLSLLMTRPLGVKGVANPLAPTGAADPEPRDQARRNAPFTVLTLDRIVSLKDYQDFARAFAGIGKAQAVELRRGEIRLVHVTVAAADGGKVDPTSDLYKNLKAAIAAQSDEHQLFVLESYTPLQFNVEAKLRINPRYLPEKVLPAVRQGLLQAFSFETRSFGQPVTGSEVIAVMQRVEGVVSVDLDRLKAEIARWDENKTRPAELLTLNPNGIELREVKP